MKVCIVGAGDAGAITALQVRRLDSHVQIDIFSKRGELGCPPCEMLAVAIASKMPLVRLVQIDSCYSPHVQEDQIAVPIQRLIEALG